MSNSTPAESTYVTATQALMELVRLKDVHDRVEEMGKFGCPDDKAEEFHALVKDYADNKAKAWAAAREVLRSRGLYRA